MSVSTSCIHGCSPLTSLNSQPKHHHKSTLILNNKLPWALSTGKTKTMTMTMTTLVVQSRQRMGSVRTNAVPDTDSLLSGAASTAKSGDITEFLLVSAGLFFMYWVTNFVVPAIVSKKLGYDQVNEDQKEK